MRKADGKDWKEFLRELARAEGIENPTDADLRRLDRRRKDKKVSNEDWESPPDPDARIARMKDGRTHPACKAEHAVELQSEAIVGALLLNREIAFVNRVQHAVRDALDDGVRAALGLGGDLGRAERLQLGVKNAGENFCAAEIDADEVGARGVSHKSALARGCARLRF